MERVLIVKPGKGALDAARDAVEKFTGIFATEVRVLTAPHASAAMSCLETGGVGLVIFEGRLDTADANVLTASFPRLSKKPMIAASGDNEATCERFAGKGNVWNYGTDLNKTAIFNALRNFLAPAEVPMDIRYIKSIITSVVDVVQRNTQVRLVPGSIREEKTAPHAQASTCIIGFCGDGFVGTMNVESSNELLTQFAVRMFQCSDADIKPDMLDDLLAELANQILGVVRTELAEYGYDLKVSMLLTVNGERHLTTLNSNGRYFVCPFAFEEQPFNLTLCYNTYRPTVREISSRAGNSTGIMDVRVLADVADAFTKVLGAYISEPLQREATFQHLAEPYASRSLHVIQGVGASGNISLGIDCTQASAAAIASKLMMGDVLPTDFTTVNDAVGEFLNQVVGELTRRIEAYDYTFHRIFHGSFSSAAPFRYVAKSAGRFVRIQMTCGGLKFYAFFGLNTGVMSPVFDAWSVLASGTDFRTKAEA